MKNKKTFNKIAGRIPLVLLWLLGIPLPIIMLIFLFRGCTA